MGEDGQEKSDRFVFVWGKNSDGRLKMISAEVFSNLKS